MTDRLSRMCGYIAALLAVSITSAAPRVEADARAVLLAMDSASDLVSEAVRVDDSLRAAVETLSSPRVVALQHSPTSVVEAFRCTGLDAACLGTLALRHGADRILYGRLERAEPESQEFVVTLSLFDAFGGRVISSATVSSERDGASLGPELVAEALRLLALPSYGAIAIRGIPGAVVRLDGTLVGMVPADGLLEVWPVAEGRHELRIERPDGRACEFPVHVEPELVATVGIGVAGLSDAEAVARARTMPVMPRRPDGEAIPSPIPIEEASAPVVARRPCEILATMAARAVTELGPAAAARALRQGIPIEENLLLAGTLLGMGARVSAKLRF